MLLPLFAQVELTEDIPEYNLKKGSIGTIVEHYEMLNHQEDGYSIEGLIYKDTVEVSESQISLVTEKSKENKEKKLIISVNELQSLPSNLQVELVAQRLKEKFNI